MSNPLVAFSSTTYWSAYLRNRVKFIMSVKLIISQCYLSINYFGISCGFFRSWFLKNKKFISFNEHSLQISDFASKDFYQLVLHSFRHSSCSLHRKYSHGFPGAAFVDPGTQTAAVDRHPLPHPFEVLGWIQPSPLAYIPNLPPPHSQRGSSPVFYSVLETDVVLLCYCALCGSGSQTIAPGSWTEDPVSFAP